MENDWDGEDREQDQRGCDFNKNAAAFEILLATKPSPADKVDMILEADLSGGTQVK